MADRTARLKVVILGDSKSAEQALSNTDKAAEQAGEKMRNAAGVAAAGAALMAHSSKNAARDQIEALSKSNTVFGEQAQAIEEWAAGGARNFGLSKTAALDAAGGFGNLFAQLDIGGGQAADMSKAIVELGADFASFHNADITDVLLAQSAAFRGEYDALQRYVPTINAAAVEHKALEMGLAGSTKELTAQGKALAVYQLMMDDAGDARGDFARTADDLANSERIVAAEFQNSRARLGMELVPVYEAATKVVGGFLDVVDEIPGPVLAGGTALTVLGGGALFLAPKVLEGARAVRILSATAKAAAVDMIVPTRAVDGLGSSADTAGRNVDSMGRRVGGAAARAAVGATALLTLAEVLGTLGRNAASADVDADRLGTSLAAIATDGEVVGELADKFGTDLGGLAESFRKVDALGSEAFGGFEKALEKSGGKVGGYAENINRIDDALAGMVASGNVAGANAAFQMIRDMLLAQGVPLDQITLAFGDYSNAISDSVIAQNSSTTATDENTTATERNTRAVRTAAEVASDRLKVLLDQRDATEGVREAQERYAEILVDLAAAEETAAGRGEELAELRADQAAQATQDAESIKQAEKAVADASDATADARKRLADAERALEEARKAAAERLRDLRREQDDQANSVAEKQLKLDEAQQALAIGMANPTLKPLELKALQQAVASAAVDLQNAQDAQADSQAALTEAEAAGIEQSPEVLDAKEQLAAAADAVTDAQEREQEAAESLARAHQAAAKNYEESGKRIAEVQRRAREDVVRLRRESADAVVAYVKAAEAAKLPIDAIADGVRNLISLTAPGSELRRNLEEVLGMLATAQDPKPGEHTNAQGLMPARSGPVDQVLRPRVSVEQHIHVTGDATPRYARLAAQEARRALDDVMLEVAGA